MRSPEQVLKALNKHGKVSDYKFERLYRILFNEEMFHDSMRKRFEKETPPTCAFTFHAPVGASASVTKSKT